ncbi:MAG: hypothetical protein IPG74_02215 [Flavobacteriales bacterium]|nr:hypothetical protein [Flavobacteriales bacterium]MBK7553020.1 hypothetical protein [Flavobacteriales bacterium]
MWAIGIQLRHATRWAPQVHLAVGTHNLLLLPAYLCDLPTERLWKVHDRHRKNRRERNVANHAHYYYPIPHGSFHACHLPIARNGAVPATLAHTPNGVLLHFYVPLLAAGLPPGPWLPPVIYYMPTRSVCIEHVNGTGHHLRYYPLHGWQLLLPHHGLLKHAGVSACGQFYEAVVWAWVR